MYKRKGSTKKGRKTPYKRRTYDGVIKAPRSISLSSWSQPFRTTLKYSDVQVQATTVGAGFVTHVLQPNSVYDPDVTGTGHQPLRFDQLAAMFNQYRVRSARIRAVYSVGDVSTTTSAIGPWRCTLTKSKTNSTLPGLGSDPYTAAEMEGSTSNILTTQTPVTLYNTYTWKELGINNIEEANTAVTASPAIAFYWISSVYNQGNVAATNILFNFDIEFDCEFVNPKTIATS